MNKVQGIVTEVISEGHLSLVRIEAQGHTYSSIVIDTPESAPYLRTGNEIYMLFKENEVVIAKEFSGAISMQNRFEGSVTQIDTGKLLCRVTVNWYNVEITSLITAQACRQLNITVGDTVTAMVKTNEIMLAPHD